MADQVTTTEVVTDQNPAPQAPAGSVETPATPAPQLDPTTGLPVQTQNPDPFADPAVAAEIARLKGQISTFSTQASEATTLKTQLEEAQGKLKQFEDAQLSEAERKEKEFQTTISERDAANSAKEKAELELVKLRAFIGSGLKPEFLRFVQGSSEEEVKESIADLQKLIAANTPSAPVEQPQPQPAPPAAQPTAPVTNPQSAPKKTFTYAEIAAMSPTEYAKNRDAILQAAAHNEIK